MYDFVHTKIWYDGKIPGGNIAYDYECELHFIVANYTVIYGILEVIGINIITRMVVVATTEVHLILLVQFYPNQVVWAMFLSGMYLRYLIHHALNLVTITTFQCVSVCCNLYHCSVLMYLTLYTAISLIHNRSQLVIYVTIMNCKIHIWYENAIFSNA